MVRRLGSLASLGLVVFALLGAGCAPSGSRSQSGAPSARPESADCPVDLLSAIGRPCSDEGRFCSPGGADPRRMVQCAGGTWNELNVPPGPTRDSAASASVSAHPAPAFGQ